jgi:hypothetical protein
MASNPYTWDDEELLKRFMNACSRAGVSGSGLIFDVAAGTNIAYAHYLKGVVLARIQGVKPPLEPDSKVRPNKALVKPSRSNHHERSSHARELPSSLTIELIFYCGKDGLGNEMWEVKFKECSKATADQDYDGDGRQFWLPLRFNAEDFEAMPETADATTQKA